jgi:hypothetical protein
MTITDLRRDVEEIKGVSINSTALLFYVVPSEMH